MKLILQRVSHASVEVDGRVVGEIGPGILALIGITHSDRLENAVWLADKLLHLRIFHDEQGKMNRSILETGGSILAISQFTLYADCSEGRRPSFIKAAPPEFARDLYDSFLEELRKSAIHLATGVFGAYMKVSLLNDGPATFLLERN